MSKARARYLILLCVCAKLSDTAVVYCGNLRIQGKQKFVLTIGDKAALNKLYCVCTVRS